MSDHKEGLDYWHNEFKKMARTANKQASEIERLEAENERLAHHNADLASLGSKFKLDNERLRDALETYAKHPMLGKVARGALTNSPTKGDKP